MQFHISAQEQEIWVVTTEGRLHNSGVVFSYDLTADYEWIECRNIKLSDNLSRTFNVPDTGIYKLKISPLKYSKTYDCFGMFAVGLEEATFQEQISLYPNPTSEDITINSNKSFKVLNVTIRNIQGKLVQEAKFIGRNNIDTSLNQSPGIYFIQLTNSFGERANFKVVKQ